MGKLRTIAAAERTCGCFSIFSALTDFPQKTGYTAIRAIMSAASPGFLKFSTGGGGYIAPGLTIWRQNRHRAICRAVPDAHHEKARDHGARVGGVYMSFPGFDGIRNIRSATADCASHNGILRGTAITPAQWNGKVASDNVICAGPKVSCVADNGVCGLRAKKTSCK